MATATKSSRKTQSKKTTRNESKPFKLFFAQHSFDMPFLTILMILVVVGLICMFSASYAYAHYHFKDSFYFIKRQLVFALIGVVALFLASFIEYHVWHKLAMVLMAISIILLVIVLALPSKEGGGVKRWIKLPGVQFQPSEIAKFALILTFAHLIAINHKKMKTFFGGYLPFMFLIGITCGLIILEPHLSGTMLVLAIGIIMMYVGGTRLSYLLITIAAGVAALVVMIVVLKYEQDRIGVWLDPFGAFIKDKNIAWQTVQSLYSIGSGGIMGQGLGRSRQKHMFLPEPQNDFIFAIICEELGLIGAVLIIILFVLLVWRGITIGLKAKDKFGSMLAIGLSVQIGIQALLNIAVVTNTIPNTGISLPFFSYGGTSLIMLLGQMGIVLAVSRQTEKDNK